ncbi:MAG TPA: MBOAT family protein [Vicinamibacterales bacterium]
MVFSSYLFLFYFLPAALLLYYAVPQRLRHVWLTIASYVFYGWANPLFVILLFTSTVIDYVAGLVIAAEPGKTRRARTALAVSLCSNLALLGFFKYFNFGADSFDALVNWIGMPALRLDVALKITLPLGISFYTFQSMSYTIDVYRGDAKPVRSFIDFACFVSMFPQLVAGPIIRFSEVADQLRSRTHTVTKFARGVAFISLGLAKKVLLANPCGKVADLAFGAGSLSMLDAWYGVLAYAFQIYFDFSGYSDMAIGLGLMLGFMFAKNFDSPYRATSITDFWRRWHISLSSWLRDYLYVPLGGNRKGPRRTYVNLFIVMLLGGLWHGAAWNFVVWGGLHGMLLAVERLRRDAQGANSQTANSQTANSQTANSQEANSQGANSQGANSQVGSWSLALGRWSLGLGRWSLALGRWSLGASRAATFILVLITWVFFRAADLTSAMRYLGDMAGLGEPHAGAALLGGIIYQPYYALTMGIAAVVVWGCPQTWDWTKTLTAPKAALAFAALLLAVAALTTQAYNPFIYFIF